MTSIKTQPLPRRALQPVSIALSAAALLLSGVASAEAPPARLPVQSLTAGIHVIQAEVAQTVEERSQGLMFRQSLSSQEGMLFVWTASEIQCFWMKNTLIPLSIAFMDESGKVLQIEDMQPQSLDQHCSTKPVRYALEMNQGWFDKRGVKVGDRLSGGPWARR